MYDPKKLKRTLDTLHAARTPQHLANDPLSFCHRFSDPADREVAAVVASSFAYGAIGIILRTLDSIFSEMGASPRRYVERFDPRRGLMTFAGFKHRFNGGRDLCALLWAVRSMIEQSGSVEEFFMGGYDPAVEDVGRALNAYSSAVLKFDFQPVFGPHGIPADSYFPFLFPAPISGSACKRLCMFLRWLVRPSDGFDLGIWKGISTAQLVIPVDTHISRISRYLGLTFRKSADWRMAREITSSLRQLDPADPTRYDFALAHLGISDGCDGKNLARCSDCAIADICTHSPGSDTKRPA
ncbi:MAG TPA: TIGR02757 family protein [Desulfuromonadales bacterium]|nr:TIGR02757 family protein [Desulfuromonadales bacterium]